MSTPETNLQWASRLLKAALDALDYHDAESRMLLDGRELRPPGFWDARTATRLDLQARLTERARALLSVVTP